MSWYCQQIGGNETSVGYDDGYVDIEGSDGIVTLAGLHAGLVMVPPILLTPKVLETRA